MRRKSLTVTMSHQLKLTCPICNFPRLTNLSHHLTTVHNINGQDRKCLLANAHFVALSMEPDQPQLSICSATTQFCNSLLRTYSLSEQKKLPNPTSDENEDELIPCPYDNSIRYERVSDTNVPVMDCYVSSNCTIPLVC